MVLTSMLMTVSCSGCQEDVAEAYDLLSYRDSTPPVFEDMQALSPTSLRLCFNEQLKQDTESKFRLNGTIHTNYRYQGQFLYIYTTIPISPGAETTIEGTVSDLSGNTTRFSCITYGANTNPASLLINEFTTKGTGKSPDRVELVATKSGSLAGITLSDGPGASYDDRCILPDRNVCVGEYVVINFGKKIDDGSFQSDKGLGLGGNNGTLVLAEDPSIGAAIMDAVVYSNKSSATCQGFGSTEILTRASTLAKLGAWQWQEPLCQAAIDSSTSTATRSINRKRNSYGAPQDTDSSNDWYITITGGKTFGNINNTATYETE